MQENKVRGSSDLPLLLSPELQLVQAVVKPPLRQQFPVGPPLSYLAVLEHQNLVGVEDSAQPVRHYQTGTPGHQLRYGSLDLTLGLGIDGARGLIENQDSGIQRQGSGEAQELPLSHAETAPALSQAVPVSFGQPFDEAVGSHPASGKTGRFRLNSGIESEVVLDVAHE
jgi:hypothetical protein